MLICKRKLFIVKGELKWLRIGILLSTMIIVLNVVLVSTNAHMVFTRKKPKGLRSYIRKDASTAATDVKIYVLQKRSHILEIPMEKNHAAAAATANALMKQLHVLL